MVDDCRSLKDIVVSSATLAAGTCGVAGSSNTDNEIAPSVGVLKESCHIFTGAEGSMVQNQGLALRASLSDYLENLTIRQIEQMRLHGAKVSHFF
jgi:hypothetical protein